MRRVHGPTPCRIAGLLRAAGLAVALAAAVAAARTAPAGAQGAPPLPQLEQLAAQFEAVAFGSEFEPAHDVVWRWAGPVRYAARADSEAATAALLAHLGPHIAAVSAATGIPFHAAAADGPADLEAVLAPRERFAALAGRWPAVAGRELAATRISACMAVISVRNDVIVWAGLLYGADIPAPVRDDCLLEELVQVMGLPNDACHYRPSLFCERELVDRLAGPDLVLLQTLYDPRLSPGMPRARAMPIVREIIAGLWPPAPAAAAPAPLPAAPPAAIPDRGFDAPAP